MSAHTIRGYPSTLRLFRPPDSRYWHCRLFVNGKMYKKTTKQTIRLEAEKFAKDWWISQQLKLRQGASIEDAPLFDKFAQLVLSENKTLIDRGERSERLFDNELHRYNNGIKQFFATKLVTEIKYKDLSEFVSQLTDRGLASSSVHVYMVFVRKVLKQAKKHDLLQSLPLFPTISIKNQVRGWFSMEEYDKLKDAAQKLATSDDPAVAEMRRVRHTEIDIEMRNFILFMVNTFMRPSDVKQLKHSHIELVEKGRKSYLRINTPFSKTVNTPIISMLAGAGIYTDIMEYQLEKGFGAGDDYVFLPGFSRDRDFALEVIRRQFNVVMEVAGLKTAASGQNRTIYSLRHTAIMLRLIKGDQIDLLTLARNARTSVEMIDRFYAKHLTAEMNLSKLQSI